MTDRTIKNLDELVENDIVSARAEGISNEQKASILKNVQVANDMKLNDMKVELQKQELSIREKELELEKEKLKSQNRKDICLAIVNGAVKILGITAWAITAATFVGSSMRMTYQDQMVPPKGLGEGLKFISSIGSKLI